jgi:hypothetical protein
MKFLLSSLCLAALSSSVAEARDSTWLLCSNGGLALNVLEHREGVDSRASELTLIYGAHVYQGQLLGTEAGSVLLSSYSSRNSSFRGNVALNFMSKTAVVRGSLSINGETFTIRERLSCKVLEGKL